MSNPFGVHSSDDGSINLVTVGLEQGPMYFPATYPQFDPKERILVLVTEDMQDGQITFNFDRVVFFSTSRVTEDQIREALEAEDEA